MTVSKTLIAATFLLVASLLVVSVYFASSPVMWFAASTMEYQLIRVVMLVMLFGLFISRPPRSIVFRSLLGASAAVLFALPVYGVLTYQIGMIDAVIFTEVAIILAIEALEYRVQSATHVRKDSKDLAPVM